MQDDRPRDVAVQIHNGDAAGYRPVPVVLLTKNGEELVSEEKPANIREEKEPLFTGTSAAVVAYRTVSAVAGIQRWGDNSCMAVRAAPNPTK